MASEMDEFANEFAGMRQRGKDDGVGKETSRLATRNTDGREGR